MKFQLYLFDLYRKLIVFYCIAGIGKLKLVRMDKNFRIILEGACEYVIIPAVGEFEFFA